MADAVLVVEDDATLARAMTRNLSARGYDAHSAASVADATTLLRGVRPDLVLLDIDLPDGSGWDVLRALRAAGGAEIPVIAMSALRPNPRLCTEMHVVGVLEKPFPMESLLRLVALAMGHAAAAVPTDADAG